VFSGSLRLLSSLALAALSTCLLISLKGSRMPGFLADFGYDDTTKIDLGKGYWVLVKNCLSEEEYGFVNNLLGGKQRIDVAGKSQFAEMDYTASRQEMLVMSIVEWNITGKDGEVWPLLPAERAPGKPFPAGSLRRISVGALPASVSSVIWAKCDELNAPRKGDDAVTFPDEPVGGDPDGGGAPAGS
jgi:hypothetical protein